MQTDIIIIKYIIIKAEQQTKTRYKSKFILYRDSALLDADRRAMICEGNSLGWRDSALLDADRRAMICEKKRGGGWKYKVTTKLGINRRTGWPPFGFTYLDYFSFYISLRCFFCRRRSGRHSILYSSVLTSSRSTCYRMSDFPLAKSCQCKNIRVEVSESIKETYRSHKVPNG